MYYGAIDSTLGLKNGLAPVPAATDPRIGFYISRVGGIYPMKGFAEINNILPGLFTWRNEFNNCRKLCKTKFFCFAKQLWI